MTNEEIMEYVAVNDYTSVDIQMVYGNPSISQLYNNFVWVLSNGVITMVREYDDDYIILNETYNFIGNDN